MDFSLPRSCSVPDSTPQRKSAWQRFFGRHQHIAEVTDTSLSPSTVSEKCVESSERKREEKALAEKKLREELKLEKMKLEQMEREEMKREEMQREVERIERQEKQQERQRKFQQRQREEMLREELRRDTRRKREEQKREDRKRKRDVQRRRENGTSTGCDNTEYSEHTNELGEYNSASSQPGQDQVDSNSTVSNKSPTDSAAAVLDVTVATGSRFRVNLRSIACTSIAVVLVYWALVAEMLVSLGLSLLRLV